MICAISLLWYRPRSESCSKETFLMEVEADCILVAIYSGILCISSYGGPPEKLSILGCVLVRMRFLGVLNGRRYAKQYTNTTRVVNVFYILNFKCELCKLFSQSFFSSGRKLMKSFMCHSLCIYSSTVYLLF